MYMYISITCIHMYIFFLLLPRAWVDWPVPTRESVTCPACLVIQVSAKNAPVTRALAMQSRGRECVPPPDFVL